MVSLIFVRLYVDKFYFLVKSFAVPLNREFLPHDKRCSNSLQFQIRYVNQFFGGRRGGSSNGSKNNTNMVEPAKISKCERCSANAK